MLDNNSGHARPDVGMIAVAMPAGIRAVMVPIAGLVMVHDFLVVCCILELSQYCCDLYVTQTAVV